MKKQLVSFVIPCYRSAETIGSVVDEIEAAIPSSFIVCTVSLFNSRAIFVIFRSVLSIASVLLNLSCRDFPAR